MKQKRTKKKAKKSRPKPVLCWGEHSGSSWLRHGSGIPFLSRTKPSGRYYTAVRVRITPL